MTRRDTIIISVLVNAALLVVLFISAISSKDEEVKQTQSVASTVLEEASKEKEIFLEDAFENTVAAKEEISKEEQQSFIPLIEEKKEEAKEVVQQPVEKIIHKLPQLAKQEGIKEEKVVDNVIKVVVQKGDTLEKIAKKNQVKIAELMKKNNLHNSFLKIGQTLVLPENKVTAAVLPKEKEKEKKIIKQESEYYIVKVGDNPYTIAMKHHMKPNALLKLNNLDEKKARKLKPGDKLRIR